MTTTEKIENWIVQNQSRQITGDKLREILLDLAAAVSSGLQTERIEFEFPNVSIPTEHDITHTLNSVYISVHIFNTDGQLVPAHEYSFNINSETEITIVLPTSVFWGNSNVIITKLA